MPSPDELRRYQRDHQEFANKFMKKLAGESIDAEHVTESNERMEARRNAFRDKLEAAKAYREKAATHG
jgi:hypothetical protein